MATPAIRMTQVVLLHRKIQWCFWVSVVFLGFSGVSELKWCFPYVFTAQEDLIHALGSWNQELDAEPLAGNTHVWGDLTSWKNITHLFCTYLLMCMQHTLPLIYSADAVIKIDIRIVHKVQQSFCGLRHGNNIITETGLYSDNRALQQ